MERLTREQMSKKYPNMWLGISNIKYVNDDGVSVESADIVYTDKTASELLDIQLSGQEDIMRWYTNENGLACGVLEVMI